VTGHQDDSWQPGSSLNLLQQRARLLQGIRAFFAERGVLEVETPVLSSAGNTDPNIDSFITRNAGNDKILYLHTSPEYPMKRLLAAGSGSIYQVCKVFRQGEQGRLHNPEFTLLEWYRIGFDHIQLMDEISHLLELLLPASYFQEQPLYISYRDAFRNYAGIDDIANADTKQLESCADAHQIRLQGMSTRRDDWLDLLLANVVMPVLPVSRLVYLHDFPASQAALARLNANDPTTACRFELIIDGIELANGYHELTDAIEQQRRFEHDNEQRLASGRPAVEMDENLLQAMQRELPDCAGVALGLDRLLMLQAGLKDLGEVLSFPFDRA
jgi:lysyl-tRNA synthetase class 2